MPEPGELSARCPTCGEELWQIRGGQQTLRNRILKIQNDGTVAAKCPTQGCNTDVAVPFLTLRKPRRIGLRLDIGRPPGSTPG